VECAPGGELGQVSELLRDGSIVAIDDANYNYVHTNVAYINMLRKKLGLPQIEDPSDNLCEPFFVEVERFLKSRWENVEYLEDSYKREYKRDLFWNYYSSDRHALAQEGMEKPDALEHRYDSWRVSARRE